MTIAVPDSNLTLGEAIEAFRSTPGFIDGGEDYYHHDILHIVYGLDTSLRSETALDLITVLGTTVTWREYFSLVGRPESAQLLREIGWQRLAWALLSVPVVWAEALGTVRRQTKRWPYTSYQDYLGTPVSRIREEFGIHTG